ncbi:MAG: WD40/YVTN/BNR-like repeat-containing protein, partial [Flavobacteriales bacterium]
MRLSFTIWITLLGMTANAQWEIVFNSTEYTWHAVYFLNDSTGFVVGDADETEVIWKTTDYGTSWVEVHSEEANYFYDVYFPSDSVGYCSAYENVLKTTDGGENWFYPNPDFEGYPYRSIVF